MRFFLIASFIIFLSGNFFSQISSEKRHQIDSITEKLHSDSLQTFRYKLLRSYANISNQQSFIASRPADIITYQLGVCINDRHTIGLSFDHLNKFTQSHVPEKSGFNVPVLKYYSLIYRYTVVHKRFYKIDIPCEIGLGSYRSSITDTSIKVNFNPDKKTNYVPLSTGIKTVLKPVQWIGVSLMAGYRYVLDKNGVLNLNTFFYSIGIWVDFRQTYRDLKYYGYQKKKYKRTVKRILNT